MSPSLAKHIYNSCFVLTLKYVSCVVLLLPKNIYNLDVDICGLLSLGARPNLAEGELELVYGTLAEVELELVY